MQIRYAAVTTCLFVCGVTYAAQRTITVKAGDNDRKIARKLGISEVSLREANPDVRWTRLQIGQALALPEGAEESAEPIKKTKAHKTSKAHSDSHSYRVKQGDNDWTLARRFGTTAKALHKLNPDVKWGALRIGKTIAVPGAGEVTEKPSPKVEKVERAGAKSAKIKGKSVRVRRSPSVSSKLITRLDSGARIAVLGAEVGWTHVRLTDGANGWIKSSVLKVASASREHKVARRGHRRHHDTPENALFAQADTGNPLVDKAISFRGVRYRSGGVSRSGVDCSGLTTTVYKSLGVRLPRTSKEQSSVGRRVGRDELKPGDLVFFKTNRGRRINHVGIYAGNGRFIHASSGSGRVRESSLDEGYYNKRFAGGRRVAHPTSTKATKSARVASRVEIHRVEGPGPATD